ARRGVAAGRKYRRRNPILPGDQRTGAQRTRVRCEAYWHSRDNDIVGVEKKRPNFNGDRSIREDRWSAGRQHQAGRLCRRGISAARATRTRALEGILTTASYQ